MWSDFTGTGSNKADYINGASSNVTEIDFVWKQDSSFGPPCVQMKPDSHYLYEPNECNGEARYICMKPVCPEGFQWFDRKSCAKFMTNPASKIDAIATCKNENAGAFISSPKSTHEQYILEQFLIKMEVTSNIHLGIEKQANDHWYWHDGSPVFVSGNAYF